MPVDAGSGSGPQLGGPGTPGLDPVGDAAPGGRVRSWLTTPIGTRLIGALFALAGVALLVFGLIAVRGHSGSGSRPGAAPGVASPATQTTGTGASAGAPAQSIPATVTGSASAATSPTSAAAMSTAGTHPTGTGTGSPTRPAVPRAPVTVLNNSMINGLGEQAAAELSDGGWTIAKVGNYTGLIPATTVYYTPGNAAQRAAAEQLAKEFPKVTRVFPRYEGLPPTPPGLVLVVTRTWN